MNTRRIVKSINYDRFLSDSSGTFLSSDLSFHSDKSTEVKTVAMDENFVMHLINNLNKKLLIETSTNENQQVIIDTLKKVIGNIVGTMRPNSNDDLRKMESVTNILFDMLSKKSGDRLTNLWNRSEPNIVNNCDRSRQNSYQFTTITICSNHENESISPISNASTEVERMIKDVNSLEEKVKKQTKMLRGLLEMVQQRHSSIESRSSKRSGMLSRESDQRDNHRIKINPVDAEKELTKVQESSTSRRRRKLINAAMLTHKKQRDENDINLQKLVSRSCMNVYQDAFNAAPPTTANNQACKNTNQSSGYSSLLNQPNEISKDEYNIYQQMGCNVYQSVIDPFEEKKVASRRRTDELNVIKQCPFCSRAFKNTDKQRFNQHVMAHLASNNIHPDDKMTIKFAKNLES